MKITFINPPFKTEYGKFSRESRSPSIGHSGVLYFPLWLIYAAAVVEREGYDICFYDACAKRTNTEETIKLLDSVLNDSSLIVLDTSTPSIYSDIKFGETVKKLYPRAFILLVGTHPSATVHETLNYGKLIDGVARKEYDYIVRDLANALTRNIPLHTVKGLSFRDSENKIFDNEDADFITNLDEIPFASEFIYKHLNPYDYFFAAASYPSIQIFTGRGCPAHCNYCVYPQTMHGHKYRLRTPESVVREFRYIADKFPEVHEVVIEDDTFTANKKHVLEICDLLVKNKLNKRLKWLCNARVNLDFETMQAMKSAGCHLIIPGIESYNQEILNNIKKGISLELIDEYIRNAKKAGLMVHACYMVGNEGETKETMLNTLNAAIRFRTDTAQFFPLIPYPGTEAYKWAKENNYITGKYEDYLQEDGTLNCIINTSQVSAQELVEFCRYARKKYYVRPWYIYHRIIRGIEDPDDLKRSLKAFWRLKDSLFK